MLYKFEVRRADNGTLIYEVMLKPDVVDWLGFGPRGELYVGQIEPIIGDWVLTIKPVVPPPYPVESPKSP